MKLKTFYEHLVQQQFTYSEKNFEYFVLFELTKDSRFKISTKNFDFTLEKTFLKIEGYDFTYDYCLDNSDLFIAINKFYQTNQTLEIMLLPRNRPYKQELDQLIFDKYKEEGHDLYFHAYLETLLEMGLVQTFQIPLKKLKVVDIRGEIVSFVTHKKKNIEIIDKMSV